MILSQNMQTASCFSLTYSLIYSHSFSRIKVTEESTKITLTAGTNKAIIHAEPFTIDFYRNDILFVTANAKGLLRFEHLRRRRAQQYKSFSHYSYYFSYISKKLKWFGFDVSKWKYLTNSRENGENEEAAEAVKTNDDAIKMNDESDDQSGAWEEEFKSHHDSKPNGPEAIALDFTFPQAQVLFGIPEHADTFALVCSFIPRSKYVFLKLFNLSMRNLNCRDQLLVVNHTVCII